MTQYPTLTKAPIQEGLIDLRLTFAAPPTQREFDFIRLDLEKTYPESLPLQAHSAEFRVDNEGISQQHKTLYRGLLLTSAAKTFVFQAQIDGFTLSHLRPYSTWPEFVTEAQRLWKIYLLHTKPLSVNRIAVRFINSFELPGPIADLKEFFSAPPELPEALPQGLSSYLVRYQIPDVESGATVLLTQTMEDAGNDRAAFVIDIDVFKTEEYDVATEGFWEFLELLRNLKNRVFFSSVTDRMVEHFR
jgi:uncharacterized protein (TIGR04255 family)